MATRMRTALAEQTALTDHYRAQLDQALTERDTALADAAAWRESATLQLIRNADLAAQPPVVVEVPMPVAVPCDPRELAADGMRGLLRDIDGVLALTRGGEPA